MKITCQLSPALVSRVLREQCTEVANLFNNNLEPSVEQIQDMSEIAKAWVTAWLVGGVGAPSAPDPEPSSGFSVTFNMDEGLDETAHKAGPETQPEADEDPFRHYVNSSENSNSSPASQEPKPSKSQLFAIREGVTIADMELAIKGHGAESFAKFCGCPLNSALGAFGNSRKRGYPGPKVVEWVKSLRGESVDKASQPTWRNTSKAKKAAPEKPEKLTEPEEPKTQCIPWARARVVCRNRTADGKAEERLLQKWINSGSTDIDWFLKDALVTGPTGVWI